MQDLDDVVRTSRPSRERGSGPLRTYRQIAAILTEREGAPVDAELVSRVCRAAEKKLARALLVDPVLGGWFDPEPGGPAEAEPGLAASNRRPWAW